MTSKKWFAKFEADEGNKIISGNMCTAIYAVLVSEDERLICDVQDLCWWDGDWKNVHYDEYGQEIEVTDRQICNEYARKAEVMRNEVLNVAEAHGIAPEEIEWEENPYNEEDPDDIYFCYWPEDER